MDDDVILFVGLAAGLRPVMAPVSANSGTIDPAAVPDATWSSLCGVLTTTCTACPTGWASSGRAATGSASH
jgi:hypothetical protein